MTNTARFTRMGDVKYIPNAINVKGFLAGETEIGIGKAIQKGAITIDGEGDTWEEYASYKKVLKPYFDSDLLKKDGCLEEVKAIVNKNTDIRDVIGGNYEKYLIRWGHNFDYEVISMEDVYKQKEEEEIRKVKEEKIVTVREEMFGYKMCHKIPNDLFKELKPVYWSAENIDQYFDEMDDFEKIGSGRELKGWFYDKGVVSKLEKMGYKVQIK